MFHIRDIEIADLDRVHEFTIRLLRHHIGQGSKSQLEVDDLGTLVSLGYVKGLLLIQGGESVENTEEEVKTSRDEPIGYMLYHWVVSSIRVGHGVVLDQFYIAPEFRRLGLGRKMMSALCQKVLSSNGLFIKLVYQDGLGLDSIYSGFGFINHTREMPGLHIFEAYNPCNLEKFLKTLEKIEVPVKTDLKPASDTDSTHNTVLVLPLTLESAGNCTHPGCLEVFCDDDDINNHLFLPVNLVVVMKSPSSFLSFPPGTSSNSPSLGMQTGANACVFTEQYTFCGWMGPLVTFTDFVGDTSLIDSKLLVDRVRFWSQREPCIRGAVWEIPCGSHTQRPESYSGKILDQPDIEHLMDNSLVQSLIRLGVPDDTMREGWNVASLNKEGMLKLSGQNQQNNTT